MSPADWITSQAKAFDYTVSWLLPVPFFRYARIFHPAMASDGHPVSWADIASWSGRTMHPKAQFEALSAPRLSQMRDHPQPWRVQPTRGALAEGALSALCQILGRHTRTSDRCWFCLWDGYGELQSHYYGPHGVMLGERGMRPDLRVAVHGPRVRIPGRAYILLTGPLDGGHEISRIVARQTPNLIWPDDHAWLVATEIDLDSTYVGGSAEAIDDLLTDQRLEAMPVSPDDRITFDSDDRNM
jgi:hypothetical protein